jgi:hypothetical protein
VPHQSKTAPADEQMSRGMPARHSHSLQNFVLEPTAPTSSTRPSSCTSNRTGRSRTFSRRCYLCSHHRHTHHPAIERLFPYSGQNTKTTTAVQSQSKVLTSPWSTSLSICINTSTPTASHVGACDASSLRSSSRFVRIDAHLILRFSGQCVGG